MELNDETRKQLIEHIGKSGELRLDNPEDRMFTEQVILRALKMIGSTREYQFG